MPETTKKKKSWKTTVAGWAAVVGSVGVAIAALLDGNPETTVNWEQVVTALTGVGIGVGLLFARDNDVSSEGTGAK